MNLITNASEAIGEKDGVVAISTGAMECDRAYLDAVDVASRVRLDEPLAEGVYVFLEVSDSGCGMDTDTLGKVFDPFFTTKFTGRGLGLAAVLGIVRGHKGAIKIYSEVGKGTTFKVLFPAGESVPAPSTGRGAEEAEKDDWNAMGKVLIADDEETVREVGNEMLERIGFEVLKAADGRIAVELFREHADEIVCVLLDLTMPGLDGVEAYREIRRIRSDTKVILCSGYNEPDAIQHFAGKGLAGFLQKPYQLKDLKSKLKEVLSE
jgi:CheY-like chemotaxis protein